MGIFGPNVNKMLARGDLAGLVATLKDKNPKNKQAAAAALGKLGNPQALDPLIRALNYEKDMSIRETIAKSLTELFTGSAILPLIHLLNDFMTRGVAGKLLLNLDCTLNADALQALIDSAAEDALMHAIESDDRDVMQSAANILMILGDRVVPKLVQEVKTGGGGAGFRNAIIILGVIRSPAAISGLIAQLGNNLGNQSSSGGSINQELIKIGTPVVPGVLEVLKTGGELHRRIAAMQVLGRLKVSEALPLILKELEQSDKELRKTACISLGEIGAKTAEPQLIKLFENDQDQDIRCEALGALGKLNSAKALPVLINALADQNSRIRYAAKSALEKMNEKPLAEAVEKAFCGDASAAAGLKDKRLVPALLLGLGNQEEKARQGACDALAQLGEKKLVDVFQKAMQGEPESLARLNDSRLIAPLLSLLTGYVPVKTKKNAARALAHMEEDGFDALINLLKSTQGGGDSGAAALTAIGEMGKPGLYDQILPFLKNKDYEILKAGLSILRKLEPKRAISEIEKILVDKENPYRWLAGAALAELSLSRFSKALLENEVIYQHLESIFSDLTIETLMEYIRFEKDTHLRLKAVNALAGRSDSSIALAQKIDRALVSETLLSCFEGKNWNWQAARAMLKLFPEFKLDTGTVDLMERAMGVGYRSEGKYNSYVDHTAAISATAALCTMQTPVASNLLHMVSVKPCATASEVRDCITSVSVTVDFSFQHKTANEELARRGNPPYDVRFFIGEI